jgi:hypothetical protein
VRLIGGDVLTATELRIAIVDADPVQIVSGGAGYIVGNVLELPGNYGKGLASVATTGPGGTVTSLTVTSRPRLSSLPGSPQFPSGGQGAGLSVNYGDFGVAIATVSNTGRYRKAPENPREATTLTGIGHGASFNIQWMPVV